MEGTIPAVGFAPRDDAGEEFFKGKVVDASPREQLGPSQNPW